MITVVNCKRLIVCGFIFWAGVLFSTLFQLHSFQERDITLRTSQAIAHMETECVKPLEKRKSNFSSNGSEPVIAVGVFTTTDLKGKKRRDAIRETWAKSHGNLERAYYSEKRHLWCTVSTKFLIGTQGLAASTIQSLQQEQNEFGDMLLLEDATNLYGVDMNVKLHSWIDIVLKTQNPMFYFKSSDDTYLDTKKLCHTYLDMAPDAPRIFHGATVARSRVLRTGHKNSDNEYDVCKNVYHPYMSGYGWGFSRDIAIYIWENKDKLRMFINDDVTFGLWMQTIKLVWLAERRFFHHIALLPGGAMNNNWPKAYEKNPGVFQRACCEGVATHLHSSPAVDAAKLIRMMYGVCSKIECWTAPPKIDKLSNRHWECSLDWSTEKDFKAVAVMQGKLVEYGEQLHISHISADGICHYKSKSGKHGAIFIRDIYRPDKTLVSIPM